MVRNTLLEAVDNTQRPVIALGNDYPDGHLIPPHRHRRSQMLYGASGVIIVATEQGNWVVPPQRAIWIPAGASNTRFLMLGAVATRSIYLEPAAAAGHAGTAARSSASRISCAT